MSALSATIISKKLSERYDRLKNKEIKNLPLIVESKFLSLKTKELVSSLKKILGKDLFEVALKDKKIRSGRGKFRGRKYKSSAGMLLVVGEKEKIKTKAIDVVNTKKLNVTDLAKGGSGRLTVYTEEAIKNLGEKLK
jgi:large subunit ribosomal protein L4e